MAHLKWLPLLGVILPFLAAGNPPIEGYLEAQKMVQGNRPTFIDAIGPKREYGLDFEFRIPVLESNILPLKVMAGAEAYGHKSGFGAVMGRAGVYARLPWLRNMEVGYFHKSEHSLEHVNTNTDRRFFSSDWIAVRYNFGKEHR